jgi:hypothetical protein
MGKKFRDDIYEPGKIIPSVGEVRIVNQGTNLRHVFYTEMQKRVGIGGSTINGILDTCAVAAESIYMKFKGRLGARKDIKTMHYCCSRCSSALQGADYQFCPYCGSYFEVD